MSWSISSTATSQPAAAKARAWFAPWPFPPPVMSTRLPARPRSSDDMFPPEIMLEGDNSGFKTGQNPAMQS